MSISEKGKTILKWYPSDDYRKTYDRVFRKENTKEETIRDITTEEKIAQFETTSKQE